MKNYQVHPTHWLISTQVLVPVGAGARTGSGLVNIAAAVHAAARRGRGEASVSEPFDRALVLAFCLRVGVGVRAAHAVFFVTLGTVSSSDWTCPGALGLRTRDKLHHDWPPEHFGRDCYGGASPVTKAQNLVWSRQFQPNDAVLLREELAAGSKEPYTCDTSQEHASRAHRSHSLFAGTFEPRVGPV